MQKKTTPIVSNPGIKNRTLSGVKLTRSHVRALYGANSEVHEKMVLHNVKEVILKSDGTICVPRSDEIISSTK
jgi:hypothetical protein